MVPTLAATRGVKGHRPPVGTRDRKDLLYGLAVANVLTGALLANPLGCPAGARRQAGRGKARRLQEAFARHLRHVGRRHPPEEYRRVALLIDNAPWHAGE